MLARLTTNSASIARGSRVHRVTCLCAEFVSLLIPSIQPVLGTTEHSLGLKGSRSPSALPFPPSLVPSSRSRTERCVRSTSMILV